MITPCQMRMARAALGWSLRTLAQALDLSAVALSRYERGDTSVVSLKTAEKAAQFFRARRIFCGPGESVAVDQDVYDQDRWLILALWRILEDHGIHPDSRQLIEAANRIKEHTNHAP